MARRADGPMRPVSIGDGVARFAARKSAGNDDDPLENQWRGGRPAGKQEHDHPFARGQYGIGQVRLPPRGDPVRGKPRHVR